MIFTFCGTSFILYTIQKQDIIFHTFMQKLFRHVKSTLQIYFPVPIPV